MADTSKVTIQISGDSSELTKAMADAVKAISAVGQAGENAGNRATSAFDVFKGSLGAALFRDALKAVVDGFGQIVDLSKEFITQATEQEQAVSSLNLALANSGRFSEQASASIQEFAASLQDQSTVADDVIIKNAAMIQSLGRLDEDGLKRATRAALDFATAFNVDFDTASRLVGKASEGNVEAFRKFGITVEDTGDKTRDFNNLLTVLEQRSNNAARAATLTFEGAFTQAGNALDDVQKTIGSFITTTPGLTGAFKGLTEVFKVFESSINGNRDGIQRFIEGGVDLFITSIGVAGQALNSFLDVQQGFRAFFTFLEDGFLATIQGFNEFGIGILEAKRSVEQFFGAQTEGTEAAQAALQANIDAAKQVRAENDAAALESIRRNEERKASLTDFTEVLKTKVAEAVEAQRAAGETEKQMFYEQQNERAIATQQASQSELLFQQQFNEQLLQESRAKLGAMETQEFESKAKRLANEGKYTEALALIAKQREAIEKNSIFAIKSYEESTQKERFENMKSSLGAISTLQGSSSQELFRLGQAAAIATATIDGIVAVQKALSSAPPPFNFVIAALVGAATAANIGKIASQKPPKGAANGAFVADGIAGRDTEPFMLSKGELVAPAKSFDQVVDGVAREKGFTKGDENDGVIEVLEKILERIQVPSIVVNGDVTSDEGFINRIADELRNAIDSGRIQPLTA